MRLLLAVLATLLLGTGWAASNAVVAPGDIVRGEVLEVKDVDAYTYLRLKTAEGETWAAIAKAPVKKGAKVAIENEIVMLNFQSKALNRTFDRIVFGRLAGSGSAATAAAVPTGRSAGDDMRDMHANVGKAPDIGDVRVPKATGADARTVAEIVTGGANLKNKSVVIRGKVVKFTRAVMGKNWLHLRDGSGSAAENTNDVVVTTQDEANIGDVVVAKGVVHTDIDLGAGYAYKVLIEEARLQK